MRRHDRVCLQIQIEWMRVDLLKKQVPPRRVENCCTAMESDAMEYTQKPAAVSPHPSPSMQQLVHNAPPASPPPPAKRSCGEAQVVMQWIKCTHTPKASRASSAHTHIQSKTAHISRTPPPTNNRTAPLGPADHNQTTTLTLRMALTLTLTLTLSL